MWKMAQAHKVSSHVKLQWKKRTQSMQKKCEREDERESRDTGGMFRFKEEESGMWTFTAAFPSTQRSVLQTKVFIFSNVKLFVLSLSVSIFHLFKIFIWTFVTESALFIRRLTEISPLIWGYGRETFLVSPLMRVQCVFCVCVKWLNMRKITVREGADLCSAWCISFSFDIAKLTYCVSDTV